MKRQLPNDDFFIVQGNQLQNEGPNQPALLVNAPSDVDPEVTDDDLAEALNRHCHSAFLQLPQEKPA